MMNLPSQHTCSHHLLLHTIINLAENTFQRIDTSNHNVTYFSIWCAGPTHKTSHVAIETGVYTQVKATQFRIEKNIWLRPKNRNIKKCNKAIKLAWLCMKNATKLLA